METKRLSTAEIIKVFELDIRLNAFFEQQGVSLFDSIVAMGHLIALHSAIQDNGKRKLRGVCKSMETLRKYFSEEIEKEWDDVDVEYFLILQVRDLSLAIEGSGGKNA